MTEKKNPFEDLYNMTKNAKDSSENEKQEQKRKRTSSSTSSSSSTGSANQRRRTTSSSSNSQNNSSNSNYRNSRTNSNSSNTGSDSSTGSSDNFYQRNNYNNQNRTNESYTQDFSSTQNNNSINTGNSKQIVISRKFAIILCIILVFVSIVSSIIATNYFKGGSGTVNINSSGNYDIAEAVAKKATQGTVGVVATTTVEVQSDNPFSDFFGGGNEPEVQTQSALGTGFVVDSNGYIVTNSHVVLDGEANSLTVYLSDGTNVAAKLLYNDTSIDVAVIKINKSGLSPLTLGDSDKLNVGEFIAAIGNPEGLEFNGTITQGIISGLNRTIQVTSNNKTTTMDNLIQIDAAINGGNSGGPLLNSEGEVVGINTAKAQTSNSGSNLEGMGFAIPINTVKTIVESIKKDGSYERPVLGITTLELSQAVAGNYILEKDVAVEKGVFVYGVENNSPAEKAGIKKGDIIVKVEDKEVASNSQIVKELVKKKSGDTITVVVYRGNSKKTFKVKLTNIGSNT